MERFLTLMVWVMTHDLMSQEDRNHIGRYFPSAVKKKATWVIGGSTVCFSFLGVSQFVPVITTNIIFTSSQLCPSLDNKSYENPSYKYYNATCLPTTSTFFLK